MWGLRRGVSSGIAATGDSRFESGMVSLRFVPKANAGPSTDHPSDEDLSLGTPTASACGRLRSGCGGFSGASFGLAIRGFLFAGPLVPVSLALEGFQLIQRSGPVGAEEAGEAAIGQDLAAGLAAGAVVGL